METFQAEMAALEQRVINNVGRQPEQKATREELQNIPKETNPPEHVQHLQRVSLVLRSRWKSWSCESRLDLDSTKEFAAVEVQGRRLRRRFT